MVRTRRQLENLSKEELIEELINVDDITSKISDLTNRFDDFLRRFEVVSSDLAITRNCNRLITERVVQLERKAVTNARYHWRESVEVNPITPSIRDEELGLNICKALSLTGHDMMRLSQTTYKLAIVWRKKNRLLWNSNAGNLNRKYLLTGKTSEINLRIYAS